MCYTYTMSEIEPQVVALYIAPDKAVPMQSREVVHAIEGIGLEGDRYAKGIGAWSKSKIDVKRHASLVSTEAIAAANMENGTNFTPADTRRNIVTQGVDLNNLVGKEFTINGVRMHGVELCAPCVRPSVLSKKPGFEKAFQGRGGLRAEILSSGDIAVGDPIKEVIIPTS